MILNESIVEDAALTTRSASLIQTFSQREREMGHGLRSALGEPAVGLEGVHA